MKKEKVKLFCITVNGEVYHIINPLSGHTESGDKVLATFEDSEEEGFRYWTCCDVPAYETPGKYKSGRSRPVLVKEKPIRRRLCKKCAVYVNGDE